MNSIKHWDIYNEAYPGVMNLNDTEQHSYIEKMSWSSNKSNPFTTIFASIIIIICAAGLVFFGIRFTSVYVMMIIGVVLLLVAFILPSNKKMEPAQFVVDLSTIDMMEEQQFKEWCKELLVRMGYYNLREESSKKQNGVDTLGTISGQNVAAKFRKCFQRVNEAAVQEIYAGAASLGCGRGIIVSNSYFTERAIEAANRLGVQLIGRNDIENVIKNDSLSKPNNRYQARIITKTTVPIRVVAKLVLAIAGFALLAYGSFTLFINKRDDKKTPIQESTTVESVENTSESVVATTQVADKWAGWEKQDILIGSSQECGPLKIKVTEFTVKNHMRGLKKYPRAQEGNKYINVYLRIKNTTDSKVDLNDLFDQERCRLLIGGSKQAFNADYYDEETFLLGLKEIGAGKTYKDIAICFMVPQEIAESDCPLALVIETNSMQNNDVLYRIR